MREKKGKMGEVLEMEEWKREGKKKFRGVWKKWRKEIENREVMMYR